MRKDNDFIYWKDAKAELIGLIDSMALEVMMVPTFSGLKSDRTDMTLAEISAHNSLIAMNNEGVRELARVLKDKLTEEVDDDE